MGVQHNLHELVVAFDSESPHWRHNLEPANPKNEMHHAVVPDIFKLHQFSVFGEWQSLFGNIVNRENNNNNNNNKYK